MFLVVIGATFLALALIGSISISFRYFRRLALSAAVGPLVLFVVMIGASEIANLVGLYSLLMLTVIGYVAMAAAIIIAIITGSAKALFMHIRVTWPMSQFGTLSIVTIIAILGIGAITAFVGFAAAPNNIDSLSYHLPKIRQWIQAGQIYNFATTYQAQNYLAPGAEEVDAVLLSLTRSDHTMFLTQWISAQVCVAAVVAIARSFGVSSGAALFAALVFASAPLVVGQAATTQNDLVATAFVSTALALALAMGSVRTPTSMIAASVAAVFVVAAVAVKPPVAIFAVPVIVFVAIRTFSTSWRRAIIVASVGLVFFGILAGPWLVRNVQAYGKPFGPDVGLTMSGNYAQGAALNIVKNIGNNIGVPVAGGVNNASASVVGDIASIISGASVNDPRYSYGPEFSIASERNEDRASNLLQWTLIVGAIFVCVLRGSRRRELVLLLSMLLSGYVIFCCVVKYQIWNGRFMLPMLVFGAAIVALAVDSLTSRSRLGLLWTMSVLLILGCVPWLVAQKWRPLVPPGSVLMTSDFHQLTSSMSQASAQDFMRAEELIRALKPDEVLLAGKYSYSLEYVWWRELQPLGGGATIRHLEGDVPEAVDGRVVLAPFDSVATVPDGYTVSTFGNVTVLSASSGR